MQRRDSADVRRRSRTVFLAASILIAVSMPVAGVRAQAILDPSSAVAVKPPIPGSGAASSPAVAPQSRATPEDGRVDAAAPTDPGGVTVTKTETTTVTKSDTPGASAVHGDLPADLSISGMFLAAHPIVKGVMALLLLASVVTWTIWLYKAIELGAARSRATADLRAIAQSGTLDQVSQTLSRGAIARLAKAAELEMQASESLPHEGIKERVALALQRVEAQAARRIGVGTGVLASVGSTGPFVGLFGTVWGIMNSFISISNSHTTNLSVVAPGIAEALLATAMGLVAAIPAVVVYNMFSRSIAAYRMLLADASSGIMRHVSRDLDRSELARYHRVAAE